MKKLIVVLVFTIMTAWLAPAAFAAAAEDYEDAYELRLAAAACLAAYSDRMGTLARDYLRQDGWEIIPFVRSSKEADARFVLARNRQATGRSKYILAVVGTETFKDFKVDLRTDKVYFAGRTPEEFAANAKREEMPDTVPKVHRGFHEYVQTALTARTSGEGQVDDKLLGDLLLSDPSVEIFLVGHSLGGAAATVAGARLLAMGIKPNQVQVITFGAPAVGNEAFCREYSPLLDLTRVVIAGDPVTGILQRLVGGFRQFGREVVWQRSAMFEKGPHAMAEYLDLAMKNYYDKRAAAAHAGVLTLPRASRAAGPQVFIAPPVNSLPDSLQSEYRYMEEALADQYRRLLPAYMLGGPGAGPGKGAAAGSKWYVSVELSGLKLKNEENQYFVTLQQTVYDSAGKVAYMNAYSTLTANMTPLEALTHDATGAAADLAVWLADRKEGK